MLTVTVIPGANPTSTGIAVTADLSSIGGSAAQSFADAGNNVFTFLATAVGDAGLKSLPVTVTDAEGRTASTTIALTVGTNLAAVGSADPSTIISGQGSLLTVTVTPGTNPDSTGIAVTADLSSIGGSAAQSFADAGNNVFTFFATVVGAAGSKSLPIAATDAQGRAASTSIALTVEE